MHNCSKVLKHIIPSMYPSLLLCSMCLIRYSMLCSGGRLVSISDCILLGCIWQLLLYWLMLPRYVIILSIISWCFSVLVSSIGYYIVYQYLVLAYSSSSCYHYFLWVISSMGIWVNILLSMYIVLNMLIC